MAGEMLSREHCLAELEDLEKQLKLERRLLKLSEKRGAFTAMQKFANQISSLTARRNYVQACLEALTPKVPTDPDQVWHEFLHDTLPMLAPVRLEQLRRRIDEVIGAPLRLVHNADLAVQND